MKGMVFWCDMCLLHRSLGGFAKAASRDGWRGNGGSRGSGAKTKRGASAEAKPKTKEKATDG